MNSSVLKALSSYDKIYITQAYTNKTIGSAEIDDRGNLTCCSWTTKGFKLYSSNIAEIRFRANENPEIFYEM